MSTVEYRSPTPVVVQVVTNEVNRLFGVMNSRLADREFLAGSYSIADMACYPWTVPYKQQGQKIEDFPHLKRWFDVIAARPATIRTYEGVAIPYQRERTQISEEERKHLFGQTGTATKSR